MAIGITTSAKDTIDAIDTLRTVLGTMVIKPVFKTDQNDISNKILVSNFQYPIVEGEDRKLVEKKLVSLINKL